MATDLSRLVDTIGKLAIELPSSTLVDVAGKLMARQVAVKTTELVTWGNTPRVKKLLQELGDAWTQSPEFGSSAIALALTATNTSATTLTSQQSLEIVWTGPSAAGSPLRRVDQVLYELIESARHELILTSYVTHEADKALQTLQAAAERGVAVRLLIEVAEESGGKLSFDGLKPFKKRVPGAKIFYWPLDRRKKDAKNRHGIFHAKCLVVDGTAALISSANLTDYGLENNIELGLVIRGEEVAKRLSEHFLQLILQGYLRELK